MKLVMSIVNNDDARGLIQALLVKGYRATTIGTTGGFLREGNRTILSGVQDDEVASVLDIIRENCHARTEVVLPLTPSFGPADLYWSQPIEVEVGGATVFIFDVERFERF
jgi:uncharacterized protein YaaQ